MTKHLVLTLLFLTARASADLDECASVRRANPRALIVATEGLNKLFSMTAALSLEGWAVGIVYGRGAESGGEPESDPAMHAGVDAWAIGSPRQLHYVQRTNGTRLGTAHVLDALVAFRPAWVVCEYQSSLQLLVETVRRYADSQALDVRAAVQRLRCSLPAEAHYEIVASKAGLVRVAAAAGVRVPASISVPAGLAALGAEARQRVLDHPLPVIIKSDHDGGGFGVTICRRVHCFYRALVKLARQRVGATVQQYVEGPTAIYEAVGLDGHLVGGYARAEIVTLGRRGPPLLSRTINEPQLEAAAAALCRALRCTGLLTIDFVVDKTSGLAYLVDPHLRQAGTTHPDGGTLGMGRGLYGRLLDAHALMARGLPPSRWPIPAPLPHSITYGRLVLPDKGWAARGLELLMCDDVFMQMPWHVGAKWIDRATRDAAVRVHADAAACEWRTSRFPGLRVPQLCATTSSPRCDRVDACRPLPLVTPTPTLTDMLRPDGLCDPLSSWARAHVRCARGLAARANGAASAAPPSEALVRGYWSEHLLCRGMFTNGTFTFPPANTTVSVP